MEGTGPIRASAPPDVVIGEILAELDAEARRNQGKWVDKRRYARRRFRTRCDVRYTSAGKVRACRGSTRDLSAAGLGLVVPVHLPRSTPVVVRAVLANGDMQQLTGTVAHTRALRDGWCLVGIIFSRISDASLLDATAEPAELAVANARGAGQRSYDELSGRRAALCFLGAPKGGGAPSRERMARVLKYARSADHVVREAAIPPLMRLPPETGVPALILRLQDPNAAVQAAAALALGELRATDAIPHLVDMLLLRVDAVALAAAHALGRMGDQRGLRVAIRLLGRENLLSRRAAQTVGVIVGREFEPNREGVAAARNYLRDSQTS
jgi:hypothetical protein